MKTAFSFSDKNLTIAGKEIKNALMQLYILKNSVGINQT